MTLLFHIFGGALFLYWAWPSIPEIFPHAGLPSELTYWQCVCILWVLQTVSPTQTASIELGVREALKSKGGGR